MIKLKFLPESARDSVMDYLEQINENPKNWRFEQDLMHSPNDIAIEDRHRMTAALEFNLSVPVICIFRA